MDYEKKYNDALKRAKAAIDIAADKDLVKGVATTIFPQLRESENERIRKKLIEIIGYFRSRGIDQQLCEEFLAYLERQKENPKSADSIPADCVSSAKCEDRSPKHSDSFGTDIRDTTAYWRGWDDAMKQKEQKHPHGCFTCDEYKKGYEAGRLNGFTAGYNKAMKEMEQKEQKPVEWTELTWKDIVELEGIINNVHYDFSAGIGQESFGKEVLERFRNKKDDAEVDACEKKPAWSDGNKQWFDAIIKDYEDLLSGDEDHDPAIQIKINLLKSIRPCPSWKPSEHQMTILKAVKEYVGRGSGYWGEGLGSLIEDLEKLM